MAWNGSKATAARGTVPKELGSVRGKKKRCLFVWCLLGTGVAVVALVLCFFFFSEEPVREEVQTPTAPRAIQDVAPAPPVKGADAEAEPADDGKWHPPKNAYKDERGIWRHPGGMRVYDPTRPRKTTNLRMEGDKPSIFRHRGEKEIERLLTLEPGQPMFGTRRYDENFEKDYLESLKEPIIITKDDSEGDRTLKQMMIDTKIEIADRMRNGETLKEILEGARSELQRMAEYKRMLRQSMMKELNDGMSEQDVDDYVKAANLMLEQNGISPLKNTAILKRNIRLNMKGMRQ